MRYSGSGPGDWLTTDNHPPFRRSARSRAMDTITIEERLAALERWAIGHGYKLPVPPAPAAPKATTPSSAALTPAMVAVPAPRDAAVPVASSVTPPATAEV